MNIADKKKLSSLLHMYMAELMDADSRNKKTYDTDGIYGDITVGVKAQYDHARCIALKLDRQIEALMYSGCGMSDAMSENIASVEPTDERTDASAIRIDGFIESVRRYWRRVPEWRFGQLLSNVFGRNDLFYMTDSKAEDLLARFFENKKETNDEPRC